MRKKQREAQARLEEVLLRLDKALTEKPIDWSKIRVAPFAEIEAAARRAGAVERHRHTFALDGTGECLTCDYVASSGELGAVERQESKLAEAHRRDEALRPGGLGESGSGE